MRCVVTGAGGFLGKRLVRMLRARGEEVCAWGGAARVDLLDRDAVLEALARDGPRRVFHLAAVGGRRDAVHDPAVVGQNTAMVANLLDGMDASSVLVITGSMAEYGPPPRGGRLRESARCAPTTAYGIGKLAATHYALARGPERGISARVARLFGVYGPGEADGRLFPHLVRALSEGVPVPLSDGRQVRDFIHVDDVCEGLLRLAEIDAPRVLVNLGTGSGVRIRDAAAWTADALGADRALLRFGAAPRSPGDENRLVADVTRLRALLSWVPPQRLRPGMDARELFGG